jgi:hypothetical protein
MLLFAIMQTVNSYGLFCLPTVKGYVMPKKMSRHERERWLFEFRKIRIAEISVIEQNKKIEEIWEFGHRTRSEQLRAGGTITRLTSGGLKTCSWQDVLKCHTRALEAFEGIVEENKTPRWEVRLKLQVDSSGELLQETESAVDAFTVEMCHILARLAPKLAFCRAPAAIPYKLRRKPIISSQPNPCGEWFLRQRKDTKYCSYKCRLRVAMRNRRKD